MKKKQEILTKDSRQLSDFSDSSKYAAVLGATSANMIMQLFKKSLSKVLNCRQLIFDITLPIILKIK